MRIYTDDVLIVGHLPHLERLTSLLLTSSLVWALVPELLQVQTRLAA